MRKGDQPEGMDLASLLACGVVSAHCAGVMAAGERLPAWLRGSLAHSALSASLLVVSSASLVGGLREHRQSRVLRWYCSGAAFLVAARLLPPGAGEGTEVAMTLVACALLGVFARLNASLRCWGDGSGF